MSHRQAKNLAKAQRAESGKEDHAPPIGCHGVSKRPDLAGTDDGAFDVVLGTALLDLARVGHHESIGHGGVQYGPQDSVTLGHGAGAGRAELLGPPRSDGRNVEPAERGGTQFGEDMQSEDPFVHLHGAGPKLGFAVDPSGGVLGEGGSAGPGVDDAAASLRGLGDGGEALRLLAVRWVLVRTCPVGRRYRTS